MPHVTPVKPLTFTLSDPGTGGRLVAEIVNCADYEDGDVLLIFDEATDKIVAQGMARIGIVNVFDLTDGTPFTGHAKVISGDLLSEASDSDTATPTAVQAAVLVPNLNVFKRVFINFNFSGGSIIEWRLGELWGFEAPFTFFVQFSHAPDHDGDHWEDVATVVDECFADDPTKRLYAGMNNLAYYRVLLRDVNGKEVVSNAQQAIGAPDRHSFLIARDIVRKEFLRLSRYAGIRGFLRKVKQFGVSCPDCLDPDTGEVVDSDCPTCFGTGIEGGYHEPIEFFVELGLKSRNLDADVNHGPVQNVTQQCRCLGMPELNDQDIWIRADTDDRYFINEIRDVAHLGVPLVVMVNLRKIPIDDPAYTVPRSA